MTQLDVAPQLDPAAAQPRRKLTGQQIAARVAIAVAVLLVAAMWLYGFVFAPKDAVAKVDDAAWARRAEQICARRNDQLAANAEATRAASDGSPQSIGAGVARGTDIIET